MRNEKYLDWFMSLLLEMPRYSVQQHHQLLHNLKETSLLTCTLDMLDMTGGAAVRLKFIIIYLSLGKYLVDCSLSGHGALLISLVILYRPLLFMVQITNHHHQNNNAGATSEPCIDLRRLTLSELS